MVNTKKSSHQEMQNEDTNLRVSLLQTDIKWEDKEYNLATLERYILELTGKTDLIVLPEMFSTGFSMNSRTLAEGVDEKTITTLQKWSTQYNVALSGSFIARDNGEYYNRGFFITPTETTFYDKRHLFRMGDESKHFSAGDKQCIVQYKGFNICLLICYDLRFPIWARNVDNKYDLLLYVANWPESRIKVWNTLLEARALENQSYVCGVNRVGKDDIGLTYTGQSALIDYKGNKRVYLDTAIEQTATVEISKEELNLFRNKFPVWKDADKFTLY